jgi:hypothetical protein
MSAVQGGWYVPTSLADVRELHSSLEALKNEQPLRLLSTVVVLFIMYA